MFGSDKKKKTTKKVVTKEKNKKEFPKEFPFWARMRISKNRTTLVIDEDKVKNKKTRKEEEGFVHREATSKKHKGFEEIIPNPDKSKRPEPMYLKRPRKLPKRLFEPHNKKLEMPDNLRERYSKNNNK